MKRSLQIFSLLVLIFAAGGVSGWYLRPLNMIEDETRRERWQSGSPRERAEAILAELTTELTLSEAQREEILPLIQENFRATRRIDKERLRLRKQAHDKVVAAIREKLEPEQTKKLDALNDSSSRRFRKAFKQTNDAAE